MSTRHVIYNDTLYISTKQYKNTISVIVSKGHTDKWVICGLLSVGIRTAERRCCLCIHIPHYPHPNPDPNLIANPNSNPKSYPNLNLRNKHQYAQPNMSANWMTSRLRDQSADRCKNCRPVPIGYTDNSLQCTDLSVRTILTITFTELIPWCGTGTACGNYSPATAGGKMRTADMRTCGPAKG